MKTSEQRALVEVSPGVYRDLAASYPAYFVEVACKDCGEVRLRDKHKLHKWKGRCGSCARSFGARVVDGKKKCSRCKKWLPLEDYHFSKHSSTGHKYHCRNCDNIWRVNNRERARAITRNYHSKRRANGGEHTIEEWETLCNRYDNICLCCNKKSKLTIDHVVPVSKGGTDDIANIQPLCQPCNSAKGDQYNDFRVEFEHDW